MCVDVAYSGSSAAACGVAFNSIFSHTPASVHTAFMKGVTGYVPGSFYLRELPVIVKLLEAMEQLPDTVIVDGYVWLTDNRPGLGAHLYTRFHGAIPVIGIAKNPFRGHFLHKTVTRGHSSRPLYVTAAGLKDSEAAEIVRRMAGKYRIPDMMRTAHMTAKCLIRRPETEMEEQGG